VFADADVRRKVIPIFVILSEMKDWRLKEMDFDLKKIGEEEAKLHGMTKEQSKGEVQYKMALKMLDILMRRGIVSEEEYKKIDDLNRQSFSPQLAKVYA
jgi:hypothetical protein